MDIKANLTSALNTLEAIQTNYFVNSFEIYNAVAQFVETPFGLGADIRYDKAVAAVKLYERCVQKKIGANIIFRNLGTITDGTVWVDTSKNNNTYDNFLAKKINENHNTRPSILEAIYEGSGFEIKQSSSTQANQSRRALRIGSSRTLSYGVLASSFEENTL